MSVNDFIPELWSPQVQEVLLPQLVYGDCANHKWEGELREVGNKVHINSVGPINVINYQKNVTDLLASLQVLDGYGTTLEITQSPAFDFVVDDVDKQQAQGDFPAEAMRRAAWALANHSDQFLATRYPYAGNVVTAGPDASGYVIPVQVNVVNILALMTKAAQILTEANVPEEGRWAILAPWAINALVRMKAITGWESRDAAMTNGCVSVVKIAGFEIRQSVNVPKVVWNGSNAWVAPTTGDTTTYSQNNTSTYISNMLFGTDYGMTFANQINQTMALVNPKGFGDIVRGMNLYGGEMAYPNACVNVIAQEVADP
jgi:hypothetical protein